jgi:hypothetical protein
MKTKNILLMFCAIAYISNAQITTEEQPYGLTLSEAPLLIQREEKTFSAAYKAQIAEEDAVNDATGGAVRYAFAVPVNYTLENSGTWQTLADGSKLWRLRVNIAGALATNTYYDKFWLPDGAKFFVYSEDTKQTIGAITSQYINGSREEPIRFATAIIYGENVTFEYYEPASVTTPAVISISRIDYGYRHINNPYKAKLRAFGDAASCNININCSQGDNWQKEKHAVARVSVVGPEGSGWCSCSLVTNTSHDFLPYVLTANHCLEGLDAISNPNADQWTFYWEYEHPGCSNSTTIPAHKMTAGAIVKANNPDSDFALLQLTQNPRNLPDVITYYLGWDRSGNSGTGGVGIHHPMGDVKKISVYSATPTSGSNGTSVSNACWRVVWTNGTTEGASSGSPLINSNHLVIGQLYGGGASCNSLSSPDYFGKFNVSWTGNGATDSRRRLRDWLDPAGTNQNTLSGEFAIITSNGSDAFCSSSKTFTVTNPPQEYTWSYSSNITLSFTSGNTATFTPNSNGSGWVRILANGTELARKDFVVNTSPIQITSFTGSTTVPNNQYAHFRANTTGGTPTQFQWILNPQGNNHLYGANSELLDIAFYDAGNYQLVCKAYNGCVWGEYYVANINVYNSSASNYSAPSPNPASSNLDISFDQALIQQSQSAPAQTFSAAGSAQTFIPQPPAFDIKLYDNNGILCRQATSTGQSVSFDVSNLPNGIYFLHVYNGIAPEPEIHKIIVQH